MLMNLVALVLFIINTFPDGMQSETAGVVSVGFSD